MCGIVGYVQTASVTSDIDAQYRAALEQLLFVDTLRGSDSTGVAVIPKDKTKKPFVVKKAVPGFVFTDLPEYKRVWDAQSQPGIYLGHNRLATRGIVNDENAHPFVHGHITLVHNGSIVNQWALDSGIQSGVDSDHIAAAIAKHGADKILSMLDGSAILVWYDANGNSMNIARTKDRAIRWVFDTHGTCWFASERDMLWAVLCRNGIEPVAPFLTLPEYHHFKWELSDTADNPGKLTRKKFEEFVPEWKKSQLRWEKEKREEREERRARNLGEAEKGTQMKCESTSCQDTDGVTTTSDPTRKRKEPLSNRQIDKVDRKLADFKLSSGDEITIRRQQFIPSKKNEHECDIIGHMLDTGIKVLLPDVPRWVWERFKSGFYRVKVYNVFKEHLPREGRHIPVLYAKLKNWSLHDMVQGPDSKLIPSAEFEFLAKDGCFDCKKVVNSFEHETTEWVNGAPLCRVCSVEQRKNDKRLVN